MFVNQFRLIIININDDINFILFKIKCYFFKIKNKMTILRLPSPPVPPIFDLNELETQLGLTSQILRTATTTKCLVFKQNQTIPKIDLIIDQAQNSPIINNTTFLMIVTSIIIIIAILTILTLFLVSLYLIKYKKSKQQLKTASNSCIQVKSTNDTFSSLSTTKSDLSNLSPSSQISFISAEKDRLTTFIPQKTLQSKDLQTHFYESIGELSSYYFDCENLQQQQHQHSFSEYNRLHGNNLLPFYSKSQIV